MRKLPIIAAIVILPLISCAQDKELNISLSSGVSLPMGKFAAKKLDGGSFAQTGWGVNLEGAWIFHHGLGVGLQAGYHAHPIDVASLAVEKVNDDPFLEELVVRSDPYRVITLAGFVQYSLKISQHFTIDSKAGGGAALGLSPYQLYKPVYYLVTPRWYEITSTRDWSGYFGAGTTFRYRLNECLDLKIGAELGYAKFKYRFLTGTGDIREDTHKVLFLDLLVGILVKL
jgi:hypothetical protein